MDMNIGTSPADKEVLEFDSQTDEEEISSNGGIYPYDPTKADIDIREDPQTVYELIVRKYDQGKLILNPDFQRNSVWKKSQQSQFIESILLNFPLPPLYVNQNDEGKYVIVDGLQRINAMRAFIKNEFRLDGLRALVYLNGKNFNELKILPGELQVKFEDKKLTLYIIKPSTPLTVVYDIFNRINTGGTQLSRQEIRNCIYLGKSTKLLKKLAHSKEFEIAVDKGVSDQRMKAQEMVLRYLAFRIFDYKKDYKGDMSDFVENAMRTINKDFSEKQINGLEKDFLRVMKITFEFFGKENFRFPTSQTRGTINMAVFETVSYFFSINDDDFIKKNKRNIIKNFKYLLQNPGYKDAVTRATGDKNRVVTRFGLVQVLLANNTRQ